MPTGEDYRFLYVMLYNMGKGYHINTEGETKSLQQLLIDDDYEIVYEPTGERDIVVGKKNDQIIGVADLWGPWAINLSEKVDTLPPSTIV